MHHGDALGGRFQALLQFDPLPGLEFQRLRRLDLLRGLMTQRLGLGDALPGLPEVVIATSCALPTSWADIASSSPSAFIESRTAALSRFCPTICTRSSASTRSSRATVRRFG